MRFPHIVKFDKDRYHQIGEMARWSYARFGPLSLNFNDGGTWRWDTVFGNTTFAFNKEQDALLFALRWA